MARRIKLDSRGISQILQTTAMHRATQEAAEKVAENIRAQNIKVGDRDGGPAEKELPVKVRMTTTDRAHAVVALEHPAGAAVQAKHGALTRAAGEVGLDVNGRR